ncbi:MAG: MFS transporter [Deltaproteobacteria bacterium]|nr:MFS transporter [Deltaproteobacteria bacterium]
MGEQQAAARPDSRKEIVSWAFYDWANSAFATTVMAGFFPIFFKTFCCNGGDAVTSTARLGVANSLSGIIVALSAPLLGAIADRGGMKKKFLAFFIFMGALMTSALYLLSAGEWLFAVIVYMAAVIGFSGGNIFYDSLLPFVASERKRDFVSALGFAFGYLGGGILFALNVLMTLYPEFFGLAGRAEAVKLSFVTVGLWWIIFSIPVLVVVKEPGRNGEGRLGDAVLSGLLQLRNTFREIRHLRVILIFLGAYWFYMDGVDTIIRMAVDYGLSIGFDAGELVMALLITQFVGFPSAILFGYLGGRIGTKRAIFIALAVYLFVTLWGACIRDTHEFYILAVVVGLVQGGVQALSRSLYSRIIPIDKSAEYFGFFNMVGKFSVVFGPLLIGAAGLMAREAGFSAQAASRIGISSVSLLFVAGGILFFFVDEERGRSEARYLAGGR